MLLEDFELFPMLEKVFLAITPSILNGVIAVFLTTLPSSRTADVMPFIPTLTIAIGISLNPFDIILKAF